MANKDKERQREDFFNTLAEVVDLICGGKGRDVAQEVSKLYGGSNIYVTKNAQEGYDSKHERIYKEFTGNNISELSRKYNLSEQAIYRSLRIVRNNKQK